MLLPSRNETFHIILAGVSGKGFLAPGNGKGTGIRKCYGKGREWEILMLVIPGNPGNHIKSKVKFKIWFIFMP